MPFGRGESGGDRRGRSCGIRRACGSSTGGCRGRGRRPSTATATRPTARTGCRSWSAVGRRSRSTCRAGAAPTARTRPASTTRCTGSRPSSSAASTSSGSQRRKLVVHDWGALALIGAQRRPDLVERLVVIDAVPLLPGYRWHWIAQIWRRRRLGELAQRDHDQAARWRLLLRQARGDRGPMPPEFVDMIWDHWDKGTRRRDPRPLPPRRPRPPRRGRPGPRPAHLPGAGHLGRPRPLPPGPLRRRPTPPPSPTAELEIVAGRRPLALDRRLLAGRAIHDSRSPDRA